MNSLIAIFLGGGMGSVLRYCSQQAFNETVFKGASHWTTFVVNIAGSFLIGLFYALSDRLGLSQEVRLALTTGLCGGFTTFSTFSNESLGLIKQGQMLTALAYVGLSVILGVVAAMAGAMAGGAK